MLARVFTEQCDHCNSYDVKCYHIVKTAAIRCSVKSSFIIIHRILMSLRGLLHLNPDNYSFIVNAVFLT